VRLVVELGEERVRKHAAGRLGDQLDRSLGEGVDGAGAVGRREGRHDDHGDVGPARAQGLQDADAVESGHRQVEREDIGAVLRAFPERLVAVGRHGHHVGSPLPEAVRDDVSHEGRVIGDDNANSGR
jgi:hypothetical protein